MSTTVDQIFLGPFTGGLNTRSAPGHIADNELAICENFDIQVDGSLKTRPSIVQLSYPFGTNMEIIGTGKISGTPYIIATTGNNTYYSTSGLTWTSFVATRINAVVFYNDVAYMIPNSAGAGGYWSPSGGWVSDASMPTGVHAIAHKSRIWVARGSTSTDYTRLQFTDPITSTTLTWTATNIVDVNAKDGDGVQALMVYNDDLMIFKNDSTWIYAFDLLPEDGIVRVVNEKIGVNNKFCFGTYQNTLYVFHEEEVYEVVNYNFTRINHNCVFSITTSPTPESGMEHALSVTDDKIIIKVYNKTYVYHILIQAWTEYTGTAMTNRSKWWELDQGPSTGTQVLGKYYIAGSATPNEGSIYRFHDGQNTADEAFTARLETKVYTFDEPLVYKRQMWWAVDYVSADAGLATISCYSRAWSDNTLTPVTSTTASLQEDGFSIGETPKLFKVPDARRFRSIKYVVSITSGSGVYDRCWINSISVILKRRQTVKNQVSR